MQGLCIDLFIYFYMWISICCSIVCCKDCFSPLYTLLSKVSWLHLCGCISVFCSLFNWSTSLFLHRYHPVFISNFIFSVETGSYQSPNFILHHYFPSILGLLLLHMNFRISLCIYSKYLAGILMELYWICRLIWQEMTKGQYLVFLFIHTQYSTTYLVLL